MSVRETGPSSRPLLGTNAVRLGGLHRGHRGRIQEILHATGAFRDEEVAVALELFDESCGPAARVPFDAGEGVASYEFIGAFARSGSQGAFARSGEQGALTREGDLAGYVCYGATPGTDRTYDLYWIAVHPEHQGSGGGSRLLDEVERRLQDREARLLVVETSSRTDYAQTRRFYEHRGYREHARLRDFYAPGDDRVIYAKRLVDQYQTLPGSGV
jgi:ribosomal protein S18 acetylase RimI-like enzyme